MGGRGGDGEGNSLVVQQITSGSPDEFLYELVF